MRAGAVHAELDGDAGDARRFTVALPEVLDRRKALQLRWSQWLHERAPWHVCGQFGSE
jgi:hypothetical protein